MSKQQKLIAKLKSKNSTFTYSELRTLLQGLGYEETQKGKTAGSRVAFVHLQTKHIIRLHKPHPGNQLKKYQIDLVKKELVDRGVIK